jgi:hypothetical protein
MAGMDSVLSEGAGGNDNKLGGFASFACNPNTTMFFDHRITNFDVDMIVKMRVSFWPIAGLVSMGPTSCLITSNIAITNH